MKKTIIYFFLTLFASQSFSQMNNITGIALDETVLNTPDMIKFVAENFKLFNATKWELQAISHLLIANKFNRVINNNWKYTLNGLPITAIYAYVKNEKQIALYLFLDISFEQRVNMVHLFDMPWNVTLEDYNTGDYDMLLWSKNNFEVSMLHDFAKGSSNDSRIVCIYNMSIHDLGNDDPWD